MGRFTAKVEGCGESSTVDLTTPASIDDLLGQKPWYTAHRGSAGDMDGEHTLAAYQASVAAGAKSIEVSVVRSSDGTLFCHHDTGTTGLNRTTNLTGDPEAMTWANLSANAKVVASRMLGPGAVDRPLSTLEEVMTWVNKSVVVFLEAKSGNAVAALKTFLSQPKYADANQYVILKHPIEITDILQWGHDHGYKNWGYVQCSATDGDLDAVDSLVDIWGVPSGMAEARIRTICQRTGAKPVMAWEVWDRYRRDLLLSYGVSGMMCAQIGYVPYDTPRGTFIDFMATKKKPTGIYTYGPFVACAANNVYPQLTQVYTLPASPSQAVRSFVPKFDSDGAMYIDGTGASRSLSYGWYGPVAAGSGGYRVEFEMMNPSLVAAKWNGGIAFGKSSDDRFRFANGDNLSSGYHMALLAGNAGSEGNMTMHLRRHDASDPAGNTGATIAGATPQNLTVAPGTWYKFQVDLTPTQVIVRRITPTPTVEIISTDTALRGGYFHLHNGNLNQDTAADKAALPHYRNVRTSQL